MITTIQSVRPHPLRFGGLEERDNLPQFFKNFAKNNTLKIEFFAELIRIPQDTRHLQALFDAIADNVTPPNLRRLDDAACHQWINGQYQQALTLLKKLTKKSESVLRDQIIDDLEKRMRKPLPPRENWSGQR